LIDFNKTTSATFPPSLVQSEKICIHSRMAPRLPYK